MRLLDLRLCALQLLCAFRVWTYGFASLYVSELFSFWCGSVVAVPLNLKSKRRTAKAVLPSNKTLKSPLRGRLSISLHISKATVYCAVSRKTRGGSPLGAVHLNIKSKMNRTKSVRFTNKTLKSPLRGRITISLNNSKATVYRAVSRKTRGGVPT